MFFIRNGDVCRGCERKGKDGSVKSMESMFENLSVSSPRVRRAIRDSNCRRLKHRQLFQKNKNQQHINKENIPKQQQQKQKQQKLTSELKDVKQQIDKIESKIRDAENEKKIILPDGALTLEEYEKALKTGALKYGGKSTPRDKYDAGWCYSKMKKKWIKYVKKNDAMMKQSERMQTILELQKQLIPLTKRQASIVSEMMCKLPSSSNLVAHQDTKSNEPLSVTCSDILLVFDTNCFLHRDGPRTILQCAVDIANNTRYENVSIMIPREVNVELDHLKTPRFRREWRCRRCYMFIYGKTCCYRCGDSMPYAVRQEAEELAYRARQAVRCIETLRLKRLYSTDKDSSVSVNQRSMYRDQGLYKNPELLRGDKSILNAILSFTRGPRDCRVLLISADASFRNLAAASDIDVISLRDAKHGLCPKDLPRIWNVVRVLQEEIL